MDSQQIDNDESDAVAPEELKDQEEASLYRPENPDRLVITSANIRKIIKSKWFLAGGGAGVVLVLGAILIIFLSTLAIPNLASNILAFEFARVGRAFDQVNSEVLSEDIAVQADLAAKQTLADKFGSSTLLEKFKNLNPQNVIDKFEQNGDIAFTYKKSRFGVKTLDTATVGDQTFQLGSKSFSDQVQLAGDVSNALKGLFEQDGTSIVVRGSIEQQIMDSLGVSRIAWIVSKFKNKTPEEAAIEQEREAQAAIDRNNSIIPSVVDPINNAEQQANQQIQTDLSTEQGAASILNNGGVDPKVNTILDNAVSSLSGKPTLSESFTQQLTAAAQPILDYFDPLYAIAMPLCIIYDGSLQSQNGQATIQKSSNEDQRSFFYLETAADQQKSGQTVPQAVGAMNAKLGNFSASNPELRANGAPVNTATSSISPQTAGNDQYTYSALNLFMSASLAQTFGKLINNTKACTILTSPIIAAGITAGSIVSWFFSDGAQGLIDKATTTGVDNKVAAVFGTMAQKIADSIGVNEAANVGAKVSVVSEKLFSLVDKKGVAQILGIAGLDLLVKMDTLSKMGEMNNGLSQGTDFANQADAGGNLNANQVMQQQFYGMPLSPTQVAYNSAQDQQYLADKTQHESLYKRYIALTNPNSLLAKIGMSAYVLLNRSIITSFISLMGKILDPATLVSYISNFISSNSTVLADSVVSGDTSNYGIVQWGYTNHEQTLMNEQSYRPLENDAVLNQISKSTLDYISKTYGPCFKDSMAILLTQTPSQAEGSNYNGPAGNEQFISRASNGNIDSGSNGGLCTDYYLGANSHDPQAYDPTNNTYDLIFRWRLQQSYDNATNTLVSITHA